MPVGKHACAASEAYCIRAIDFAGKCLYHRSHEQSESRSNPSGLVNSQNNQHKDRRFVMNRAHAFLLGIVFLASAALAQMETPKPAPELKKLDYFAGNWTSVGDVKPGPMGKGGVTTIHEHLDWMDGKFFLVNHGKYSGADGSGNLIAFLGYDPQEKVYTYNEFNSAGEAVHAKGTVDGDTWTWTSEMKMGDKTMKTRFTEKEVSPTEYTYKFEMSSDGTNWNSIMDGKATKVVAAKTEAKAAAKQ
jgi:Protein of unknown function (DUF1579)